MKPIPIAKFIALSLLLATTLVPWVAVGAQAPSPKPSESTAADSKPSAFKYRGFTLDESKMPDGENRGALESAVKEQIDIVYAVKIPKEMMAFFQQVPLVLADTLPQSNPGLYGRDKIVRLTPLMIPNAHKPILLHELMHAYHHQKIDQGFKNPDIVKFYEQGKGLNVYREQSHMMSNTQEFFACSATTYLYGVTAQEPFNREKLQENQPELIAYLGKLFGTDAGKYTGSLTK